MNVKLSVDTHCIKDTPKANIPYGVISGTTGKNPCELSLEEVAEVIENGYTISSPIYKNGIRKKENIIEIQLFILDFDGKDGCTLACTDALKRAGYYNLPVVISYETKSSVNWSRYRLIFLYNEPVKDIRIMDIINKFLLHIFPEADNSTKDLSKMFLPGRNVRLHGGKYFHIDTLVVATKCFCKASTWSALISNFKKEHGLVIKDNDIFLSDNIAPEEFGDFRTNSININMEYARISPKNGGIKYAFFAGLPKEKGIKLTNVKKDEKARLRDNAAIKDECPLMYDFDNGIRLQHEQWFGLATNLINIKGGQGQFAKIIDKYSDRYDNAEFKIEQMRYAARMNYKPQSCSGFCLYSDECPHSENMILTLKDKRHRMKRINGYSEKFAEVGSIKNSLRDFFCNAVSNEFAVNILKAPTGSGKST